MCNKVPHPGELLYRLMQNENMSQHDLAIRTGVTDKHISTIINQEKNISNSFAKKLSYVFEYDYKFWAEKQAEYDIYQNELAGEYQIQSDEYEILKELKEIYEYIIKLNILPNVHSDNDKIVELRKFLRVTNLTQLSKITYNAAYRMQTKKNLTININVLSAWQRLCEVETKGLLETLSAPLNIDLLQSKLQDIRKLMFEDLDICISKLQSIFMKCGIAFNIIKHFKGAPVQGFIKKVDGNKLMLCLTIRGAYADRFWFTLFHEIGHIINEDYTQRFVDFESINNTIEERADEYAKNIIIDNQKYIYFVRTQKYDNIEKIQKFAIDNKIPVFMVIGRLQKDNLIDWSLFTKYKPRYEWLDD